MKIKYFLTIALFSLTSISKGQQDVTVEKSIFGIETGYLGVWAHNEARLSNKIALRSEIGFNAGIWGGSFWDKTGFALIPVITLEPRWYYNLEKRNSKSKDISGNSGNFVSLQTSYYPGWFVISNYDGLSAIDQISIIPTWGIKRNIGIHFNFETGIGIGYIYSFLKSDGYSDNQGEAAVNLLLRIGYRF